MSTVSAQFPKAPTPQPSDVSPDSPPERHGPLPERRPATSSFGRGRDFSKPKDIAAEFEYIEGKLSQFVTKERLEEAKDELIDKIDGVERSTTRQIEEVKQDVRGVKEDVRKLKADVASLSQQISRNETASNIRYFDLRQEVIQQGKSLEQHGRRLDRLDNTVADMNVKLDWLVQNLANSLNVPPPPSRERTPPLAGPSLAPLNTSFLNEPPTPSPRTPLSPRSLLPRSLSKSKSLTALSSIFRGKGKRKDDGA